MLFRLGPPPNSLSDAEFASGEWVRVGRTSLLVQNILTIPIGALMVLLVIFEWAALAPEVNFVFAPFYQINIALVLTLLSGVLLRLLPYPGRGFTNQTLIGVWPSRLALYAGYVSNGSKSQFIASMWLPLLVLGFFPPVIASLVHTTPGWDMFVSCLSVWLFSTSAILALPVLLLPKGSIVGNRGFDIYWRNASKPGPSPL